MLSLPASTSAKLHLDVIDYQKVLRMMVVVFFGASAASIATTPDLMSHVTSWQLIGDLLAASGKAGIAAVGGGLGELFRRFITDHTV